MEHAEVSAPHYLPGAPVSRRRLLKSSGVLAGVSRVSAAAAQSSKQGIAYVGAYTDKGKGVHMFHLNPADGTLKPWKVLTGIVSPSWLAFHPTRKYLYAVNESANAGGAKSGSVTSMSVDPGTGDLRIMNAESSGGRGPAHLSVHPSGKWLFVANYGSGSAAVLPVRPDGLVGPPADVQQISGPLGPQPAAEAPPGSFAISGHDAPHAHQAQPDPAGNYVLVSDLGTDRIYVFRLNQETGRLTPAETPFLYTSPGAGPRHFSFHPNGRILYAITEQASTVVVMDYDAARGKLTKRGRSVSTLPPGFAGTNYPSGISVSENGKVLYGANRLHDTIVMFDIETEGGVRNPRWFWTRGSYPRDFEMEPSGNFMYVCHSRSDNITTFRVNRSDGTLAFTGQYVPVGNPSKIVFLSI